AGCGDGAAIWRFALIAAPLATVVSPREDCDWATNGLRAGAGGPGLGDEAWSRWIGQQRGDRDDLKTAAPPKTHSRSTAWAPVHGRRAASVSDGEVISGGFFEAGCNASELLELAEAAFRQMSLGT